MGYVGDGVLCAVDGDGDGYTDVDMSLFHYCQTQTENILCTQVLRNVYSHAIASLMNLCVGQLSTCLQP